MRFRAVGMPGPSKGVKIPGKLLVLPDQSLSLQEILQRFTRNEALPVGHNVDWGGVDDNEPESELDVDLEKLAKADLTYKDDFREKVNAVKERYEREERERQAKKAADKKAADIAAQEKRIRIEARKLAKKQTGTAGSI